MSDWWFLKNESPPRIRMCVGTLCNTEQRQDRASKFGAT